MVENDCVGVCHSSFPPLEETHSLFIEPKRGHFDHLENRGKVVGVWGLSLEMKKLKTYACYNFLWG